MRSIPPRRFLFKPGNNPFQFFSRRYLDLVFRTLPTPQAVSQYQATETLVGEEDITAVTKVENGKSFSVCPGLGVLQTRYRLHFE